MRYVATLVDRAEDALDRMFVQPRRESKLRDRAAPKIDGPVTVLFAPDAQFRSHFHYIALLARTLADRGHNTLVIRCYRAFDVCPPCYSQITMRGEGELIAAPPCRSCGKISLALSRLYGIRTANLTAFLDDGEADRIRREVEQSGFDAEPSKLFEDPAKGLALIDFPLVFKALDFSISTPDRSDVYRKQCASVAIMLRAAEKIFARYDVRQVVIYGGYSIQSAVRMVAERLSVPCYQIANASHRGIDWQRLSVQTGDWSSHSFGRLKEWECWRHLALSPRQIAEFADDLLEVRLGALGQTVFSPARSASGNLTLDAFGLDEGRRTIVCFTSSPDERDSAEAMARAFGRQWSVPEDCYDDQIAWIQDMVEAVEASDDLQLIVRIHPREGRVMSGYVSDHFHLLNAAFGSRTYRYCRFIWPNDAISSYGLAELADLVAVAWTSMGHELARMGVPIVSPFARYIRVPDATYIRFLSSRRTMVSDLREALHAAPSPASVIQAYRWCNFAALGHSIDLSDIVPRADKAGLQHYRTPLAGPLIERLIIDGEPIERLNRIELEKDQGPDAENRELAAVAVQLRRMFVFLMTGEARDELCRFALGSDVEDARLPIASSADRRARLESEDGQVWAKFSPIATRMLYLIAKIEDEEAAG